MKKMLAVVLVICLAFAGFLTWKSYTPAAQTEPVEQEIAAVEELPYTIIDFDAMYATHSPDEVVLRVGEKDVTWDSFFYFLQSNISYLTSMFSYYGMEPQWDMPAEEGSDITLSESMSDVAKENIAQVLGGIEFARLNGAELTEEDKAAMKEQLLADTVSCCGEGATEEQFYEYLASVHVSREVYELMGSFSYLDNHCFNGLYGENCELISDEQAQNYIDANSYTRLNHILFSKTDAEGNALDEQTLAQKKELAAKLAQELKDCGTDEKRLELFAKLKEENCDDPGKLYYPEGYVVTPDASYIAEFLDTGYALEDYRVSDPVESSYGYHIIMRVPIGLDDVIDETYGSTARMLVAEEDYNKLLTAYLEGVESVFTDSYVPVNVSDYVVKQ